MSEISVIGLDLAKQVFQIHGVDSAGRVVVRKQLRRGQLQSYFARLAPCLVGMEACASAHYWSRTLGRLGHTVRLMAPVFVKPYLKSNKNDRNDAEAICEAVQRPTMRFVSEKTPEQQAILHLHRGRELAVRQRVALNNHLRAVLLEYGIALPQGLGVVCRMLPELLEDADNGLPEPTRFLLASLKQTHDQLTLQIDAIEERIGRWHADNELSQRLAEIPGIGTITATALVGTIGDGSAFRNGRQLAAYLGLVPRQASSGGRQQLLGISKRGDGYLRRLLVHGARSVIRHIRRRMALGQPGRHPWVEQLLNRCHPNEVAVALANKMARIAWVMVHGHQDYRAIAANPV